MMWNPQGSSKKLKKRENTTVKPLRQKIFHVKTERELKKTSLFSGCWTI